MRRQANCAASASSRRPPAIRQQCVPRDEAGLVRKQVEDGAGDFWGFAEAAQGVAVFGAGAGGLFVWGEAHAAAEHGGVDGTGGDGVHADIDGASSKAAAFARETIAPLLAI